MLHHGRRFLHPIPFSRLLIVLIIFAVGFELFGQIFDSKKYRKKPSIPQSKQTQSIGTAVPSVSYTDKTYPVQKETLTFRIIVLGGSAAAGFGEEQHKNWSALLEQNALRDQADTGLRVEIINMARGANTSVDDYVTLVKEALPLKPNLVIIYHGWNDLMAFTSNPGWMVRNTNSRLSEIGADREAYDFRLRLKKRFYLVRKYFYLQEELEHFISMIYFHINALRNQISPAFQEMQRRLPHELTSAGKSSESLAPAGTFEEIMRNEKIEGDFISHYPQYKRKIKALYMNYYSNNIKAITRTLDEANIPALFVFQPDLYYIAELQGEDPLKFTQSRRLLGERADIWKMICQDLYPAGISILQTSSEKNKFAFVNITEAFRISGYPNYFLDNVHNTHEGHQFIASTLYEHLKRYLHAV